MPQQNRNGQALSACGSDLCAEPAGVVLDLGTLTDVEALLGRSRLVVLLTELKSEIGRLFLSDGLAPDLLSRNAHGLAGASGSLGFTALSRACAALEEGCRRQTDPDDLRRLAREAGESALEALSVAIARLA